MTFNPFDAALIDDDLREMFRNPNMIPERTIIGFMFDEGVEAIADFIIASYERSIELEAPNILWYGLHRVTVRGNK